MASNVIKFVPLTLTNDENRQNYTISVTEALHSCVENDPILPDLIFREIAAKYPIGEDATKILTFQVIKQHTAPIESLKLLQGLGLTEDITEAAKCTNAKEMQVGSGAKFDNVARVAYTDDGNDEQLMDIASVAPNGLTSREKVRYMEVVKAAIFTKEGSIRIQTGGQTNESQSSDCHATGSQVTESQAAEGNCSFEGRVQWNDAAVRLMFELRLKVHRPLFDSNTTTDKQAWTKVSLSMKENGKQYTWTDCQKKYNSMKRYHRRLKEANNKTGNNRHSWCYFQMMEELFAGDPALEPLAPVSSMPLDHVASVSETCQEPEQQLDEAILNCDTTPVHSTPSAPKKRRRMGNEEPAWVSEYRQQQQVMHNEAMELEKRRVNALEAIVALLERQSNT